MNAHCKIRRSFTPVSPCAGALLVALAASACGDEDNVFLRSAPEQSTPALLPAPSEPARPEEPTQPAPSEEPEEPAPAARPLVIVSERETPDESLQYLHVVPDWPEGGRLDFSRSVEVGDFVYVRTFEDAIYVYEPPSATLRRFTVDRELDVRQDPRVLSFSSFGPTLDAENIFVSRERAYLLDESSGQIIVWNPTAMEIIGSTPVDEQWLERDGLRLQFQQGIARGSRAVTAMNWRDWSTYEALPGATLGIFDATSDAPTLTVVSDERCAPSVALNPFFDEDGNAYVIGDGGLGFDVIASPNRTPLPQCVVRVRAGETRIDPDFFVDLHAATGSPGFYTAHPMADRKLLVNVWAPDVDPASVADPVDPGWYWSFPPYFEYAIVVFETGTSRPVTALPRAAVQFSLTLKVDDENYVQLYAENGAGTRLFRVDTDGSVAQVLELGEGADIQYLGRVTTSD